MPTFTPEAKALLKRLEGFRGSAYMDSAGVLTCGYGHVGKDVNPATIWTPEEAERVLDRDLASFTAAVSALTVGAPALGDQRYSALVIFSFNVGVEAFKGSTLRRLVLAGHYDAVPAALREWIHVHRDGKLIVDAGLVKRRDAEIRLWNSGADIA